MKKVVIIIISVLSILSCNNHCKEDTEFKRIYHKMLDTIMFYGKQFDVDEDKVVLYVIELSGKFFKYSDYLKFLTHHDFHCIYVEAPMCKNLSDLKADIEDLKKWYEENKCGLTREKADSIIKANWEKMFYGKQFDVNEDEDVLYSLVLEIGGIFSDYVDYILPLTQHRFHHTSVGIYIYENQSDLEADIKDLKKWYEENKCGLTREKADSIVKTNYEKLTGRKESDLLTYILSAADE